MDGSDIRELQKLIGYTFRDESLILQALTHSSFCNEQLIGRCGDYERLEFLGDAVLESVSSEFLYGRYPDKKEDCPRYERQWFANLPLHSAPGIFSWVPL